jgi:Serine carboxypeptidase
MMHLMGDTDGILSLPGAWKWIKKRKFTVTRSWAPWLTSEEGDLIGFIKEYGCFSLVTVHGHGHSALASQYKEVPKLLNRFIFD